MYTIELKQSPTIIGIVFDYRYTVVKTFLTLVKLIMLIMLNLTMSNRLGLKCFLKMAQCDTCYQLSTASCFLSPRVLGEERRNISYQYDNLIPWLKRFKLSVASTGQTNPLLYKVSLIPSDF